MYPGFIIKNKRQSLGLTLGELSRMTSFSVGYLSKLERAESMPPLATLQKLAEVLDIDITELLDTGDTLSETGDRDIEISRFKQSDAGNGSYTIDTLMGDRRNRAIVPTLMRIPKGETDVFEHDAEEFMFVVEGEIYLSYKGKEHKLSKGDGVYIDSRKPHSYINRTEKVAVILTANYIYRRF